LDDSQLKIVVEKILNKLTGYSFLTVHPKTIPVGVSNRHVHLSAADLEILFGRGYRLTKAKELSQPGQYAANEQVTLAGPKGCIERVRVLGPVRKETQVEVSRTDAYHLGLTPPLRDSGKLDGSEMVTLVGPRGSVWLKQGLIVAKRHLHLSPADAEEYKVVDGEEVQVCVNGERALVFAAVTVRVHQDYVAEFHIDIDEANAAGLKNGDYVSLLTMAQPAMREVNFNPPAEKEGRARTVQPLTLVTEEKGRTAARNGSPLIVQKNAVITPLARDAIKDLGVEVIVRSL